MAARCIAHIYDPNVEVRGSLGIDIPRAEGEGYIYPQTSDDWDWGSYVCAIHLAAMVHIIYALTENKTRILLSSFSYITASLAVRCDSKSLPNHSRALVPFFYRVSLQCIVQSEICQLWSLRDRIIQHPILSPRQKSKLLFTFYKWNKVGWGSFTRLKLFWSFNKTKKWRGSIWGHILPVTPQPGWLCRIYSLREVWDCVIVSVYSSVISSKLSHTDW